MRFLRTEYRSAYARRVGSGHHSRLLLLILRLLWLLVLHLRLPLNRRHRMLRLAIAVVRLLPPQTYGILSVNPISRNMHGIN